MMMMMVMVVVVMMMMVVMVMVMMMVMVMNVLIFSSKPNVSKLSLVTESCSRYVTLGPMKYI